MVSIITFIQANLQLSTAVSGILTRTSGVKGIYMTLIQEPWYREDCINGLEYSRIYPLFCGRKGWTQGLYPCEEYGHMDATRILL